MQQPKDEKEFWQFHYDWVNEAKSITLAEYKCRGYSSETLNFIRVIKGAALFLLRESCGLPSWTTSKVRYMPWRNAELLMLPEYIIDYYDGRRIDTIRTSKNVTIFTWQKGFLPVFKQFYDAIEASERDRIDAVARKIEKLIKGKYISGQLLPYENSPTIFKERLNDMLDVFESDIFSLILPQLV